MYLSDIFTLPVNIAGLPGTSVPCGFVNVGGKDLPVGLQVLAKPFDEADDAARRPRLRAGDGLAHAGGLSSSGTFAS